ncbi:MAG: hypothetical protein LC689_11165 [Myxococcales bacterium]|nr:hypothetical protein [Myxococcales bacterium]
MIRAASLAAFSALLGGAIALVARKHPAVLERTRTFAFAAAAGVVAFHLLPEVLSSQGLVALLWMAVGFALPWALEAGARAMGPGILQSRGITGLRVAAEVGFAALVFHSVAEGLALVAALAQPQGQLDLEVALVAHHAPLTAAVVLPFLDLRGPRTVATRAVAIGAAGAAGAVVSVFVPGFTEGAFLDTATAVTAGALLHVVSDEIRAQRFVSRWERAADIGACVAGLLVAGLSAVLHVREQQAAGPLLEFLRVFGGIAILSAPAVLFGAIAGALLAIRTRFFRWDAFLLALVLLGPLFAVAFGALTVLFAIPGAPDFTAGEPGGGVLQELVGAIRRRAPPLLALSFVAAGLEVASSPLPTAVVPLLPVTVGLVLCSRLDEAGAVAVAAVLIHKGLDPGIAVAVLAIGPFTRGLRVRTAAIWAGALALLWRSGVLARAIVAAQVALAGVRHPIPLQASASPLGAASAAVVIAIALATLWTAGVRGWFAPLRHGPRTA